MLLIGPNGSFIHFSTDKSVLSAYTHRMQIRLRSNFGILDSGLGWIFPSTKRLAFAILLLKAMIIEAGQALEFEIEKHWKSFLVSVRIILIDLNVFIRFLVNN